MWTLRTIEDKYRTLKNGTNLTGDVIEHLNTLFDEISNHFPTSLVRT